MGHTLLSSAPAAGAEQAVTDAVVDPSPNIQLMTPEEVRHLEY